MGHNRKLVLGGVALTMARNNRNEGSVMVEISDEIEQVMITSGYLKKAPFRWIGLMLRYGLKNDDEPVCKRIGRRDGELPLAIELDTHELRDASREELKRRFMIATLKSLIYVGKKYRLPTFAFEERLEKLVLTNT